MYIIMHLSMFSSRRERVAGLPQVIKKMKNWGLISNLCDTILCPKFPGRAFKFRHNFFEILSLKNLRSRPCTKVVCQIPESVKFPGGNIDKSIIMYRNFMYLIFISYLFPTPFTNKCMSSYVELFIFFFSNLLYSCPG